MISKWRTGYDMHVRRRGSPSAPGGKEPRTRWVNIKGRRQLRGWDRLPRGKTPFDFVPLLYTSGRGIYLCDGYDHRLNTSSSVQFVANSYEKRSRFSASFHFISYSPADSELSSQFSLIYSHCSCEYSSHRADSWHFDGLYLLMIC